MKITSIAIRNHSRISDCTIDVRDNLILVGANGSGKSSIIRCIDLALGKTTQQLYYSIDSSDFEDEEQPFTVDVKLGELSEDELSFFPDDYDASDNSLTVRMAVNRRRILELYDYGEGLSIRQISEPLGTSRNTIRKVIQQAGDLGITKEALKAGDGSAIDALFAQAGRADSDYEPLDYGYLSRELDSPGVNLKLLRTEYCQECASRKAMPYQYSRFCGLYKEWARKANVTRRILHKPSYACQVDWVGDSGEVRSRVTGEASKAYYFVMTMSLIFSAVHMLYEIDLRASVR